MSKLTGEQIRDARVAKKLTMHGLAKQLGITAPQLSAVEHGRSVLTDEQDALAQKILEAKPRVSERSCVGRGADFEAAIKNALEARRRAGFEDVFEHARLVVDQHYIEPYRTVSDMFGEKHGQHHTVVLRKVK